MILLLAALWFIWELKYILFWLYLWQLKEYHIGRFIDHFRTNKGKRLLFSFEQTFKFVLLLFLSLNNELIDFIIGILTFVYAAEALIVFRGIFTRSFKKPVITFKTLFLIALAFSGYGLILFTNLYKPFWLLTFDILTPLIISVIVLFFQPFFVYVRNIKLKKAKDFIEKVKPLGGLKVIAITGSYGKTSTKEFLTTILSKKFRVLSTKDHQNSEVGIANCILNDLKPSHQIFIAEVGAYNKGKVKEVCNILKPKIGIVTGVNEQHLALFGSLENLLSGEGGVELAEFLEKDGLLVVNGDNKYCLDLVKRFNGKEKIYAVANKILDADIWSDEISVHRNNISFVATDKSGNMTHFDAKVLGRQNVQNLLGAILIAKELGMSFGEISEACKSIKPEQAGMILKQGKHGIDIIDSSYSANPDGVFADLDYLSIFQNKKIVVMPCLIELGKKSPEIHEKIGRKIGEVCDLAIITSKDYFKELKKGFNSTILEKTGTQRKILLCDNPQEIYSAITLFAKSGDAVLIEGRVPKNLLDLLIK